ncbi:HAD family hydrolase [Aliiruegeria sabulilitoris]|uniref:HAD family hydrolase n=1 Tax=Aliiruegeria sabulilitoris TaxID=1510458 RepID=UPI00082D55B5|nr:HAD family phosphatase [Aliiruegeria sabulilitoris]NDR55525.1 HAD family phosphatase [Pseudoruegeria sp. M32A2M]
MPVELVIFDIGNVLIEWNPERYYDATIGRDRREAMFAEVDLHGMNDQVDRGADFRATIYETAERYPEWRDEIRMWHDNWIELAQPAIEHSVRLLRALRAKGLPVQALTNFGIGSFEVGEAHYPFLKEFDMRHISGHMQVIKPDPRIYEMVEECCGFAPEAILFVDDRVDNIATAEARGWQGHLFEHPKGWADRLVAEGLLSAEEAA